jgi:hypothetical protein
VRRPGEDDPVYGAYFPGLAADLLDLPLQVLQADGRPESQRQSGPGTQPPHTIVRVEQHYLATVRVPGPADPGPGDSPPDHPGTDSGSDPGDGSPPRSGSRRGRDVHWAIPVSRPSTRSPPAAGDADPAGRVRAYLMGEADLDAGQLRQSAEVLLTQAGDGPGLAQQLLDRVDDDALGEMFDDGSRLAAALDTAVSRGVVDPGWSHGFYRRFDGGHEAVAAGFVRSLVVFPSRRFIPALVDPALDGMPVNAGLSPDQARNALLGRSDAEMVAALAGLPPVQLTVAIRWILRARAAAGWTDRGVRYLTGDPAVELTPDQQLELVRALLTGMASPDERWLALRLMWAASFEDLRFLADPRRGLLRLLQESIPPGHELRPELESFLKLRFSGPRERLETGPIVRRRRRAGKFSPGLLGSALAGVRPDQELGGDVLDRIELGIILLTSGELTGRLMRLPPVELARATRWLTGVRVALYARGTRRPEVMPRLDRVLATLYGAAAASVPGPGRLRQLTIPPPAVPAEALRSALEPIPSGEAGPFINQLSAHGQDFHDRLKEAYYHTLEEQTRANVDGREDRTPRSLLTMEHIEQISAAAEGWINRRFGHLTPDLPGISGRVYDHWEYAGQEIENMDEDQKRAHAKFVLSWFLTMRSNVADVVREHRAVPRFDRGEPNREAQIIDSVVENLLDQPSRGRDGSVIDQVLNIYRHWPAQAYTTSMFMTMQRFRSTSPEENQWALWHKAQIAIHEKIHLRQHQRYRAFFDQLARGTHANNTLAEGVPTLLTEIVWAGVNPRDIAARRVVEGPYAVYPALAREAMPGIEMIRYASMADVMRLVHLLGGDVTKPYGGDLRNLYRAFFLGEVELIGLAIMGSPQAPLPGAELAALVRNLNPLSAAELRQVRISVFTNAPRKTIEKVLSQPGAEVMAVWTADGRYVRAERT